MQSVVIRDVVYAERRVSLLIVLTKVLLNAIILSVIMLSVMSP